MSNEESDPDIKSKTGEDTTRTDTRKEEITKFIAEEPEREDETLNKDDNDEEKPVVKEEEEEILNEDDKDGNETVVTDDEEEEPKVIAIEKGDESTDEEVNDEEGDEKDDKSHVEEEEQTEEKHEDADDEKSDTEDEEEKEEKDENEQENTEEDTKSVVIITKEADDTIDNTREKEEESPKKEKEEEEKTDEKVQKEEEKEEEKEKTEDDEEEEEEENEKKKQRDNGESDDDEVDEDGNPIRIGMKKRKKFEPKGQLTNVLVTRDMEEKNRNKSRSKKKKGGIMKIFAKGKSKKFGEKRDSSADSQDEEKRRREGGIRAEFMAQYEHKKNIEKELDEQHYWSDEKEDFKYDGDFDFDDEQQTETNVAPADTVYDQTKGKEQTEDKKKEQKDKTDEKAGDVDKDPKDGKDETTKQGLTLDQKEKTGKSEIPDLSEDDKKRENGKDSGMETGGESPDPKKEPKQNSNKGIVALTDGEDVSTDDLENMYSDSDDDMFELPPGLIRDSEGRIIRESDGHVVSDHITEREYKKARLGRLFNIPRLKRSKKGRPVGGYIQDNYGPKVDEKIGENEDGPVLKHRRHSNGLPVVTDLATTNSGGKSGKSVMFDMDDNELPLPGVDIKDNGTKDRRSVSSACRKLLKKRLFKQKRKQGKGGQFIQVGSANDNPRELNDLVKVYGRPGAFDGQSTGQPTSNFSKHVKLMDQDQIARNREGLAKDKHILEKLQTADTRGKAPFGPREAFMGQSDNIIEEMSLENESIEPDDGRRGSVDIGDEDEFFWVGKGGQQQEPFFTKVKHPRFNNGLGLETQKSFDMSFLRHDHEKRHTIPWSLIYNHGSNRELTGTDLTRSQNYGFSKSAGASREKIDDRRLRELLEELYRDKKYFDHVVETTNNEDKTEIDERFLAEHGRDYLLDRAEFWEGRQPLPPHRPPATALGLRLSRLQTNLDSGRMSMTSNTSSQIPHNGITDIPGQVGNSENATENEQSSNDNSNNNSTSKINDENKENFTRDNKKETDIVSDDNNT